MNINTSNFISTQLENGHIKVRDQNGTETDYEPINNGIKIFDGLYNKVNVISVDSERPDWIGFTTCDFNNGYNGTFESLEGVTFYSQVKQSNVNQQ